MTPQPSTIEFVRPPPSPLWTSGSHDDADEASSAHPHLLLYCFPHAGGSPSSFRDWQHHLQHKTGLKVAVRVLSLPGRGGRFQETPWDDWGLPDSDDDNDKNDYDGSAPIEAAANAKTNDGYRGKFITALTQAFLLDWDGMTPYAFFGHSFGTLLAYELILQLRRRNIQPLPLLNVVSAHRAPGISPELCGIPQTHTLPRSEFVDMIKTWGLVPEEALDDEELVDIMIPALRADLRLDETHIPELLSADKLAVEIVPTVLYGGTKDQTVPSHQLLAWKEFVSPSLPAERTEVVWFEGDHFFTVSHLTEVAVDLGRRLKSALENVDQSILVGGMCGSFQSPGVVVESTQSGDRCLVEDGFNDETDRSNSDDENSCPTVLDLFFDQVRRTPNFLAMVDETGKEWTYTELQAAVIVLGQYLIRVNSTESIQHTASEADATASKCQPPRVGIFLHHVSSYLLANLSSWYAGCSVVLLERNWTGTLLREFIEVCKVDIVVTDDEGMVTLMEAGLSVDSADAVPNLLSSSEEEKKDTLSDELASTNDKSPSPRILIFPSGGPEELEATLGSSATHGHIAMDPDDVAFVSMTSGSTGKPSAVLTTHRGTTFCFEGRYELYPYRSTADDPQEREGANVFFAWESIRPLLRGHVVVIIPDEAILSPPHFVNFLHRNKVTRLVVTPSLLESVFTYPHLGETLATKLAHMYGWFLMGEVVPMRLIERAEKFLPDGVQLVNAYSSWEALDVSYSDLLPLKHCQIKLGDTSGDRTDDIQIVDKTPSYAPVGYPLPKVHALLLDENDHPVPRGVPGTLHVLTPALALGYLDDPVKTSARFRQVPSQVYEALLRVHPDLKPSQLGLGEGQGALLFNSGDKGRILPDGQLGLLGRGDDTVKIRGYKVGIPFVESTLNGIDGVATAVVLPILDDISEQPDFLAAYLVGHEGKPSETTLKAVAQTAKELLPPFAVPRDFIGIEALPLRGGESRKLDKKALPVPPSLIKKREMKNRGSRGRDFASHKKEKENKSFPSPHEPTKRIEQIISQVWTETLHLDGGSFIDLKDNFFDVGGNSLLASELIGCLSSQYGLPLSVLDLYQHSSLGALVQYCQNLANKKRSPSPETALSSLRHRRRKFRSPAQYSGKIAIVGMSGKFPGASNLQEFWENIQAGKDSLRTFTKAELASQGLLPDVYNNPKWVPVGQVLDDADKFDAAFWDISPREARTMDPQHRVFLEVAWSALEDAGYPPQSSPDGPRTGVWAACGFDGYLVHHLKGGGLTTPLDPTNLFLTEVGNEKDYISTRVSYALDLGGPSMTVTSACSSGLVAVAQAAQSLMVGQTDVAIAGASSLTFPNMGYCYEKGMVGSIDGHVRPFDEGASGTLFGDGVGAVVLKRLEDALEDGDHIWSLLSGFDVTNDGRQKAGYAAPSANAQAAAIVGAMDMAGVSSEQISYVECHATATHVGDAIELQGLSEAFQATAEHKGSLYRCALGSVKGNIGHANCAAGISGLIKTILMLKKRQLTPTAHFIKPNSKLSDYLDHQRGSPFYINRESAPWDVSDKQCPRRAGVSSFGIGGTNVHVVLEEYSSDEKENPSMGDQANSSYILPLSAKSQEALMRNTESLANYLQTCLGAGSSPIPSLRDIAYTLQCGRETFPWRRSVVVQTHEDAVVALRKLASLLQHDTRAKNGGTTGVISRRGEPPSVVMCFPGQGSHYSGMARALYDDSEGVGRFFRAYFDKICAKFNEHLDFDLCSSIFPDIGRSGDVDGTSSVYSDSFASPAVAQPAIFAVELALAQTLLKLGVQPLAVAGHSIGEYVAAAVAGVLTIDDAVMLIAERAKATAKLPENQGAMLFVKLSSEDVQSRMDRCASLSLSVAAINGPEQVVISGPEVDIVSFAQFLENDNILCRRLKVTHAFHSKAMAPVAARLNHCARSIKVGAPRIPLASNVTGRWIGGGADHEMADPDYWGRQALGTVRWMDNTDVILRWCPTAFVEVGPGNTLVSLLAKFTAASSFTGYSQIKACTSLPHARDKSLGDCTAFNKLLGTLWEEGAPIDWSLYNQWPTSDSSRIRLSSSSPVHRPKRVPLPTYSFDKTSYWTNPEASIYVPPEEKPAPTYKVDWQPIATLPNPSEIEDKTMFTTRASALPLIVKFDRDGLKITDDIVEATKSKEGLALAFHYPMELAEEGRNLLSSSSTWQLHETDIGWAFIQFVQDLTTYTASGRITLICPSSLLGALSVGASRSIVQEYPKLRFLRIFLPLPSLEHLTATLEQGHPTSSAQILSTVVDKCKDEIDVFLPDGLAANGRILAQKLELMPACDRNDSTLSSPSRRSAFTIDDEDDGGTYLITGGTGALGQALIKRLISHHNIPAERIVLLSRSATKTIMSETPSSEISAIQVDCTDPQALDSNKELQSIEKVNGIFHLAGMLDDAVVANQTRERLDTVVAPKAAMASLLGIAMKKRWSPRFVLAYSSTTSLLGYAGQSNYGAANAILDHMATNWNEGSKGDEENRLSSIPIVTVNWGSWGEVGMAAKGTKAYETALKQGDFPMSTNSALLALESLFERLLVQPVVSGQYAISGANWSASPWNKNPILSRLNVVMDRPATKETSPLTALVSNDVESSIVSLLSNHISRWEPNETLVTLGLDSLDMLQLVRDISNTFDIDLGLQDVMNSDKTLEELVHLVAEKVVMDNEKEIDG